MTKTSDEALTLLLEHGVPAGPVYDAAGVSKDPHFREREAVVDVSSGEFGTVTMQGVVPKLSHTPGAIRWTGGKLGTHNDEVYAGVLGLSPRELADLKSRGIV
jgi:crotonobetainyl-CoA:carnitine CoA-transferase CaiB-like acyl-CoA transferase